MNKFKNLLIIIIPLYFTFVIITMNRFDDTPDAGEYSGRYLYEKTEILQSLLEEFAAIDPTKSFHNFSNEFQKNILENNVVLDSTIISSYKFDDEFYVNIQIGKRNKRIFAHLSCDEDMYEEINSFRFFDALIVADISEIKVQSAPVNIIIDDKLHLANFGEDIILSGKCIEAIELASF